MKKKNLYMRDGRGNNLNLIHNQWCLPANLGKIFSFFTIVTKRWSFSTEKIPTAGEKVLSRSTAKVTLLYLGRKSKIEINLIDLIFELQKLFFFFNFETLNSFKSWIIIFHWYRPISFKSTLRLFCKFPLSKIQSFNKENLIDAF